MSENLLLVPVFLPIAVGVLVFFIPKMVKGVREAISLLTAAIAFVVVFLIFRMEESHLFISIIEIGDFNLHLDLLSAPLASFILLFATGFGLLISLFSASYMAGKERYKEYYGYFLFALGGTAGVFLANHFLLFLIFWEMVTASLYFLITTGEPRAREGATKSFAMIGASDACLLMGVGILWFLNRTFVISDINLPAEGWLPVLAFLLLMVGSITKAGAVPMHTWIPTASEGAPASVMAYLPAALDKLLGIYLLVMISTKIFVLGYNLGLVLMIIGAVTIIAAVMFAMVQHELPKLLSYHAVSQVGYMVLGIGTLTPIGIVGGLFHMLNNSIYKSCLFLCGGSVEKKSGSNELGDLGGLSRSMPITFITALIAALAISGIPPLNGFASKWLVYQGVLETGKGGSFIFLIAAMFGSALTLASFIKVIYSVFLGQKSKYTEKVTGDSGFAMVFPVVVLAILCLFFGIFYRFPVEQFIAPGVGVSLTPMGIWESPLATILLIAGIALGLIIYWIGRAMRSVRTADTFVGGEKIEAETIRVEGTYFYDTIKELPLMEKFYLSEEKGHFDLYILFGKLRAWITGALQFLHNGILSTYLSWSLLGIIVLLCLSIFLL